MVDLTGSLEGMKVKKRPCFCYWKELLKGFIN
jgi:hypothetical protein